MLDENLLMILDSESIVFNVSSKIIESRIGFLTRDIWEIDEGRC
jgi:hypothetical protein